MLKGSTDVPTVSNSEELETRLQFLENENRRLKEENERLKSENTCLLEKVSESQKKPSFSFEDIKDNDKLFKFYTGLPDYLTFKILFNSFGNAVDKLVYYDSGTNPDKLIHSEHNKCGPKRSLTPDHEFFLVLVRLRLGLLEEDLAYRVSISAMHISRILITWIDFLHNFFRAIPIWTTRACTNEAMPECFKDSYPTTRVIIDCTELFMADRGFEIDQSLLPNGVTINIPPFLRGKDHLTIDEEQETRQIVSARIHVERSIARIKTFRILNSMFPITMATDLKKIG